MIVPIPHNVFSQFKYVVLVACASFRFSIFHSSISASFNGLTLLKVNIKKSWRSNGGGSFKICSTSRFRKYSNPRINEKATTATNVNPEIVLLRANFAEKKKAIRFRISSKILKICNASPIEHYIKYDYWHGRIISWNGLGGFGVHPLHLGNGLACLLRLLLSEGG
jgi:hypothetical protein